MLTNGAGGGYFDLCRTAIASAAKKKDLSCRHTQANFARRDVTRWSFIGHVWVSVLPGGLLKNG